jgi:DNA repair protein RecO (recombination protein O)
MEWHDQGIVLSVRKHGESSVIVDLLTAAHGRHAGVVRGGRSHKLRPLLQPGNRVQARWSARLADHLGLYVLEPLRLRAAAMIEHADRLLALQAACALLGALAEREAHAGLFAMTDALLEHMAVAEDWPALLVLWELRLLAELGYGLDLTSCAATGATQELVYVSPKSGRAVSRAAGEPYRDKLLPLPAFVRLGDFAAIERGEIAAGLRLTGHFLERCLHLPGGLPEVRLRLAAMYARG